jgi:TPR repeat protein
MGWIDDWRKKHASDGNRLISEMPIEARRELVEGMAIAAVDNGDIASLWAIVESAESAGEYPVAEKWLKKIAGMNDPDALFRLGLLFGRQGDVSQSIEWYLKSAESGDRDALFNLGNQYMNTGDRAEALRWYTKSAEAGDVDAMVKITGEYLQTGQPQDALRWAARAVEAGSMDALTMQEALSSALRGDANSAAELGDLMRSTDNLEQAAFWYRKAADAGNANAALALGGLIGSDALIEWIGEAIKSGNPAASALLRQLREDS